MNNYRKGAQVERDAVNKHKANGAILALRSAGSHSPADVIAIYPDKIVIQQYKKGAKPSRADRGAWDRFALQLPLTLRVEHQLVWVPKGKRV